MIQVGDLIDSLATFFAARICLSDQESAGVRAVFANATARLGLVVDRQSRTG